MKKNAAVTVMVCLALLFVHPSFAFKKDARQWYQLTVYHFTSADQEKKLDDYFSRAYVPALHKLGFKQVGVFKAMANDTAADKKMYVLIPAASAEALFRLNSQLETDKTLLENGKAYLDAAYNEAPYQRMETILLQAFVKAPTVQQPQLQTGAGERVYELRSYESATEALHRNKVKMFNDGGETVIFKRLGFNAVFYADVIAGCHMPNLMYMTSFDNMAARDAHWKAFGSDPEWKKVSGLPEYQHNVSRAEINFLRQTPYSDL
jgi:hypothetical protein